MPFEVQGETVKPQQSLIGAYLNRQPWWIRLTNKEYWNANIFFVPLAVYVVYLAIKARSAFFFSAANPAIPTGGLVGESKADINDFIPPQYRPKTILFRRGDSFMTVKSEFEKAGLLFPVILKPVVGCRGLLVEKAESYADLLNHTQWYHSDFLIEEYIDYPVEGAVLYWKNPETGKSGIQSVTLKVFLNVIGDGKKSVDELLMDNPRGVLQVKRLLREQPLLMAKIPTKGEKILVEPIGNHCRGTQFVDGNALITPNMVAAYDKIQADLKDCYVYRLDVKAPSLKDLQAGRHLKILEINGVGADPAHIFDVNASFKEMFAAYFRLWRTIYEVGTAVHRQGVPYISYKDFRKYVKQQNAVVALTN
jgi:hypothetical protein